MDEVRTFPGGGFGILSRAEDTPSPVALVLLSAGLTHRVGPFRCYVHFARRLARRGVHVFRFDVPRVGDGPARGTTADAMVTEALDLLEQTTGTRRFVVGGICSAADMAWRIAPGDPRIVGVWLFDGFAHRGRWYRIARLRRALRRPLRQWPALAFRVLRLLERLRPAPGRGATSTIRDWPEPEGFRQQAGELLARGVRIRALYTGGVSSYLLHPRQLDDTFGGARRHPSLEVDFRPSLDHTLMSPADREDVAAGLENWLASFAPAAHP